MNLRFLLILIIATLLLAACGKKGPVKPKPEVSQTIQSQVLL